MCVGGCLLCISPGLEETGSALSISLSEHVFVYSLSSVGHLHPTTDKTTDKLQEGGVGRWEVQVLVRCCHKGAFCPHFLQQQPARLCQGQDAHTALCISELCPKRVSWGALTL